MTIISNLHNMRSDIARKVSESIPNFLDLCQDEFIFIKSIYHQDSEKSDNNAQLVFNNLKDSKEFYKKCLNEAQSDKEREKYEKKIGEIDKRVEELQIRIEQERKQRNKSYLEYLVLITAFAAAAIGVTVNFGKKFQNLA